MFFSWSLLAALTVALLFALLLLHGPLMVLVLYGGTAWALWVWVRARRWPLPTSRVQAALVGAVVLGAGTSTLMAADPARSAAMLLQLISLALPAWLILQAVPADAARHAMPCVHQTWWPKIWGGLAAGWLLAMLWLAIEGATGGALLAALSPTSTLDSYNRGLGYALLLSVPLWALRPAAAMASRRLVLGLLLLALAAGLVAVVGSSSATAQVAALLLLSLTALSATPLRAVLWLIPLGLLLGSLLLPLLAPSLLAPVGPWGATPPWLSDALQELPGSWRHRLEIWDYATQRLAERPIFGHGLNSFNVLDWHGANAAHYIQTVAPAAHPHNMLLQVLVELGWPLGLLLLGWLLGLLWRIRTDSAALAVLTVALAMAATGFSAWSDSWWAALTLAAWLLRQRPNGPATGKG